MARADDPQKLGVKFKREYEIETLAPVPRGAVGRQRIVGRTDGLAPEPSTGHSGKQIGRGRRQQDGLQRRQVRPHAPTSGSESPI
ncbi:MAG: hypothetical protein RIS76_1728 [Verrucomicrobiota bacterium]